MTAKTSRTRFLDRILWDPLERIAKRLMDGQRDWNQFLHYQVQVLYMALFTLFALVFLVFEFVYGQYIGAAVFGGIIIFAPLSSYLFVKLKIMNHWFHFVLFAVLVAMSISNYYTGGPTGPNMMVFVFVMVGAPCAMGRRGLIWSAVTILVGLGFKAAQWSGHQFPVYEDSKGAAADEILTLLSTMLGIFLVMLTYETTRNSTVRKLMKSEEDLRVSQEALSESRRMEGIGRLAGGVAHDFNNHLTTIIGCAEIIQSEVNREGQLGKDVRDIIDAGRRAAKLTQQLLAYSRKQILQPESVNLNAVIWDLSHMLKRVLGEKIEVHLECAPDLWDALLDVGQMEQVILNLAINATEAMGGKGTLTITTMNAEKAFTAKQFESKPVPSVVLRISDTGRGMPPEVASRIFEPFFSVREGGTGLGLAVVDGIVQQHDGIIELESEEGEGSTFTIHFPALFEKIERRKESAGYIALGAHPKARILVVENETSVLKLAERMLTRKGFQVVGANSAEQALGILEGDTNFNLVFTDVVLPNKSGLELARDLSLIIPDVPVLVTSGYAKALSDMEAGAEYDLPFISKPYGHKDLFKAVSELLGLEDTTSTS